MINSGVEPKIRAGVMQVLQKAAPVEAFSLLNSHSHADHVGKNDLIQIVEAKEKHHYLAEAGLTIINPIKFLACQFQKLYEIYNPAFGFRRIVLDGEFWER